MEGKTSQRYPYILDRDWKDLGYIGRPIPKFDDVPSTKHAIFRYKAWSRPQRLTEADRWREPSYDEGKYKALCGLLDTTFYFASKLLGCPASLDFIYEILNSRRERLPVEWDHKGESCWVLHPSDPNKSATSKRKEASEALDRLAKSLRWQVITPDSTDPVHGYYALTAYSTKEFPEGINIKSDDESEKTGLASIIKISDSNLEKIQRLRSLQDDGASRDCLLRIHFSLAVAFCHEIAHAIEFGQNYDLLQRRISDMEQRRDNMYTGRFPESNEPYFGDETLAEIGYCWENQVFGGQIHMGIGSKYPLFVVKWPTFDSDTSVPMRQGFKGTATRYIVPMYYLWNVRSTDFWEKLSKLSQKKAPKGKAPVAQDDSLRIKKQIGYRLVRPDRLEQDPEWNAADSSEGEYGTAPPTGAMRGSNRIDRKRRRIEPDPSSLLANTFGTSGGYTDLGNSGSHEG